MTKYTKILWDASKKHWILPDGSTLPSFNWEKFHKFGDHLEFKTINKSKEAKVPLSGTDYYEKYYGRRSRPNKHDKLDTVLDTLVGAEKKTPVKAITVKPRRRVIIKKSSSRMAIR
jgi:hypothetical protein